ncbi:MAG: bifunctional nuclease family protein [Candidatus Hydrothermarchaeaceae archaeon]
MKKQLILIALALVGISIGALTLSHKYLRPTSGMLAVRAPSGYVHAELRDVEIIGHGSGVIYLAESDGGSVLPIYISEAQARTIAMLISEAPSQRPFMHDLMGRLLDYSNLRLEYVSVDKLDDGIYYSTIVIKNGKSFVIDARPSDSIILALTKGVPIYINEELLRKEGITTHPPVDVIRRGFPV